MTRPLRVLLVLPSPVWGGAETLVCSLLEGRTDVRVVALASGPAADEAVRRGLAVDVVPVGRTPLDIAVGVARLVCRWRRLRDVDVVLANGVKAAAVAVPAAWLTGLPVVWAKHDFSFDDLLARPLARLASAVVANSDEVAQATGRDDVVVLHPPRPRPPLDAAAARERLTALGIPATAEQVVACVGRLVSYKGFDDVIEALARPEAARWHAVVLGGDDPAEPGESSRLRSLAATRGLLDRVHLLGPVADAGRLLAGVAAVAVPTRVDATGRGREGWSLVADEAMAAGVPVVAASGGPLASRLDRAGLLFEPGDRDGLAVALGRLDDPGTRERMGAAGRAYATTLPTVDVVAARFLGVLTMAATRPGAGVPSSAGPPMTVVVPARNEEESVEGSLRAIVAQLHPGDELVVVHDPSTDDTGAVIDRFAADAGAACRVVHRRPPAFGIASARNEGVRLARNEHVACTDMGCVVHPEWLDALRAAFSEQPPPDLVTGLYEVGGESVLDRAFALSCYPRPEEARRAGPFVRLYGRFLGRAYDATLPTGRSLAFTREAWAAVGGFPEHLATAEDVGFGRALAAAGRRCVSTADAVVTWRPRADLGETVRMYHRYGTGDGQSGDTLLVGRNLARLAAYVIGPFALVAGGRVARATVVSAAAVYLSLPIARAVASHAAAPVYPLLPVALALKDVAKGVGCLRGLLVHFRS